MIIQDSFTAPTSEEHTFVLHIALILQLLTLLGQRKSIAEPLETRCHSRSRSTGRLPLLLPPASCKGRASPNINILRSKRKLGDRELISTSWYWSSSCRLTTGKTLLKQPSSQDEHPVLLSTGIHKGKEGRAQEWVGDLWFRSVRLRNPMEMTMSNVQSLSSRQVLQDIGRATLQDIARLRHVCHLPNLMYRFWLKASWTQ